MLDRLDRIDHAYMSQAGSTAKAFHVAWMSLISSSQAVLPPSGMDFMEWTTDHREWYRRVYLKSGHWAALKSQKLAANPKCERCDSGRRVDVHHKQYRNLFDVKISDLETLCRKCHKTEHQVNGTPKRKKVSYWNYIPQPAQQLIDEQTKAGIHIPKFDFKTKRGRLAYSIWSGKTKWRHSDWEKYGIPQPDFKVRGGLCSLTPSGQ